MSPEGWTFETAAFERIYVPWRQHERDPEVRQLVIDTLLRILENPARIGREDPDHPGIFLVRVPRTEVVIVFTLDFNKKHIYLATMGSVPDDF